MTDEQFNNAINRLKNFRQSAAQVLSQTKLAIDSRNAAIKQSQAWIDSSKITLQKVYLCLYLFILFVFICFVYNYLFIVLFMFLVVWSSTSCNWWKNKINWKCN